MLYSRLYTISGRVQGVGFRYFTAMHAQSLGVTGYVLNKPDGSVEVCAEGNPEQVQALHRHLAEGPHFARVVEIRYDEREIRARSYRAFSAR